LNNEFVDRIILTTLDFISMFLYTFNGGENLQKGKVKNTRYKVQGAGCKAMRLEGYEAGK